MKAQKLADSKGVELLGFTNDVALCDRGRGYHPYVTWRFYEDHFYSGNYFETLEEAKADFKERI
tara:strand:+ start:383 stop:574 length:192 start_codon:yes stop_codon:yes gene_type:complete